MIKAITSNRISNAILIKKKKIKKLILVEGSHDKLFFLKFKDENCSVELAYGWKNVIQVLDDLKAKHFENCIGVIDADLKKVIPEEFEMPDNIFMTDLHDINIETIEHSFNVIYKSHCSEDKNDVFTSYKKITDLKNYIYELSKPLSFLRILSKRKNYHLSFKSKDETSNNIDYSKFINKEKFEFTSLKNLVETVINFSRSKTKNALPQNEILLKELADLLENERNKYEVTKITNGHDFGEIITLGLKKCLGSNQHIKADNILRDCILNYEYSEFKKTNLYLSIRDTELKYGVAFLKN
ncbi:hypothetical protein [Epilithonimonas hungarica]|uniref:DUF4435 domain-containing protein n=1 Tax=Epilithonimonas hungarica TaxID=454006 RepID=A0A1G7IA74_9FLAO|nr:hypothetical protein [Epilithonimonas hungarica]SDF09621.1 hypothetical protein SAMN05421825_1028 [Epilithonimonas hungarica]